MSLPNFRNWNRKILKDIIDTKNKQAILKIKENKLIDELVETNNKEADNGN